jgi:hypothetical protein
MWNNIEATWMQIELNKQSIPPAALQTNTCNCKSRFLKPGFPKEIRACWTDAFVNISVPSYLQVTMSSTTAEEIVVCSHSASGRSIDLNL